jgi:hypothetical protein
MRRLALQLALLLTMTGVGLPQTAAKKYSQSLWSSCSDNSFLSVSASAPRHDSFVNVELSLVDPQGRTAGEDHQGDTVPKSQYGRVVEIPSHPDQSKVVAIEICRATPGAYHVSLSEHGEFDYVFSVTGLDGHTGNESRHVTLHADGDRACHFRFNFRVEGGKVSVQWLDKSGRPLPFLEQPTCERVPRS